MKAHYLCNMHSTRFFLFFLFSGLLEVVCLAQTPSLNPFELAHRLREIQEMSLPAEAEKSVVSYVANPFDVAPHTAPKKAVMESRGKSKSLSKLILRPQPSTKKLFVLFFLFGAVCFLTLTFAVRRAVTIKTWQAFFSNNYLKQAQRDYTGMIGAAPFYLLYLHFFVNFGLFIFLTIRAFTGDQFNHVGYLVLCIVLSVLAYLLKHSVVLLAGWLCNMRDLATQYNLLIIVFCCVLSFFLLPANFLLAMRSNTTSILPFWITSMIVVFYIFRYVRSIGLFGSEVTKNYFHFLLYICAVEMLPIAVLIKFAISNLA
jgi:Domain of unknown function (DUF4271)